MTPTKRKGRPRVLDIEQLIRLRQDPARYTWAQIAEKLGVNPHYARHVFNRAKAAK